MSEQENVEEENIKKTKKKVLFENVFAKLKKIKHLDKILTVLFIAIILLIYFSTFTTKGENKSQELNIGQANNRQLSKTSTIEDYQAKIESQLQNLISSIKGVGKVSVFVSFDSGIETVIAYTTQTTVNKDGTKTETKSPVLITDENGKSKTIILQENMPMPKSVLITAVGAENTKVKLDILRAVQTVFDLETSKIEIFAGN